MPEAIRTPTPTEVDTAVQTPTPRPSTPARPAPVTVTPILMNAAPAVRLAPPAPEVKPETPTPEPDQANPPPSVEQTEARADAGVVEAAAQEAGTPTAPKPAAPSPETGQPGEGTETAAPSATPADPKEHPAFQEAVVKLRGGAAKVKKHEPAVKKAQQAQAAAKPPANEKAAGAKTNQVGTMKEANTEKQVDKTSFLDMLRAEIAKVMPKNLSQARDYMDGNDKKQLKGALTGEIGKEKEKTTGSLRTAADAKPDESKIEGKQVTPIPETNSPRPPKTIGAAEAMPPPRSDEEIKPDKSESDRVLEEADVTTPQLKKANDPRFDAVVKAKDEADAYADNAPGEYRQREGAILEQATAQASSSATRGLDRMSETRINADARVGDDQQTAKSSDEDRRKKVTDHIEEIYRRTKDSVELKLKNLETEVNDMFDKGVDAAIKAMRDYVESRFDDRYSGVIGKGRWLKDKLLPLPAFAKAWFGQAHDKFKEDLDKLVVRVAALVERRLKEAKDEISAGEKEIKDYVAGLDDDLKEVGESAAKEITSRFDELRKSVDEKRSALAEQLAQRYKAAQERGAAELQKLKDAHKSLVERIRDAILTIVRILREFKERILALLRKAASAIRLIVADPSGFLKNILAAVKQGLHQFIANIWKHLKNGFMVWLFGSLAKSGIQMPKEFTIGAIFGMILQVLGLTYDRIRAKAVRLIGERNVAIIEQVAKFLRTLITQGPAALWEQIKEFAGNLYDTVVNAVQQWVIGAIIRAAITKLVSMFNPVGAIIQAILMIYHVVTFFIEHINDILEFVNSVIESVDKIARGQIGAAANWIEQALARTVPIIIGFLASLLGIGGISQKIREIIRSIQDRVDKAIDLLIAKIVKQVKALIGRITGKGKEEKAEGDPKALARQKLKDELRGDHTHPQIVQIARRVETELRPQGVQRIQVDEPNADGEFAIRVAASALTPEVLLSVETKQSAIVNLAATIEFAEPVTITPRSPESVIPAQAKQQWMTKKGTLSKKRRRDVLRDPNDPNKVVHVIYDDLAIGVIRPESLPADATSEERAQSSSSNVIQVLAHNVGGQADATDNYKHAEARFISWFNGKYGKPRDLKNLRRLTIHVTLSPCTDCASDLVLFGARIWRIFEGPGPKPVIELTYDKPYIGRRRTLKLSTKVSDISNIESKGHIQVRSVGTAVTLTGQGLDKLLHEQMFGTKS